MMTPVAEKRRQSLCYRFHCVEIYDKVTGLALPMPLAKSLIEGIKEVNEEIEKMGV